MTAVHANRVALGIDSFGDDDTPLLLLAGGTTMLSWPDALCERLAAGGRRVVRYDLRDSGESTTADPEAPAYSLRDLAADVAALAETAPTAEPHDGSDERAALREAFEKIVTAAQELDERAAATVRRPCGQEADRVMAR